GGLRLLFSHNAQFGMDQVKDVDRASLPTLARLFPCLGSLRRSRGDRVELVNSTIVEAVLMDLGKLDFGKGVIAKCNAALWRQRGDRGRLVGEFSFKAKSDRRNELHAKVRQRCERLFVSLQEVARDWVSLGTTKPGVVYHLRGNPPQSHE